ncbi:MAG: hypothetical protein LBE02_04680 [Spirochaetaceae bacterium]|jgi:hypothetical protein|nr:hypothetical protein [Spirochaetaceae bacterium]
MNAKSLVWGLKLPLLCILAVGANYALNTLSVFILKLPLFLDTVFTCAVTFTAGPVAGIAVAVLTTIIILFRDGSTWLFVLCSITEVLLVWFMQPGPRTAAWSFRRKEPPPDLPEIKTSFVNTFAALLLLYIAACVAVSVLGGILDFILYDVFSNEKLHYSPEDTFKMGLLRNGPPILAANILSRIPINIVDRFIVIFGGFAISRFLKGRFRPGKKK